MCDYQLRLSDKLIARKLKGKGAVLIEDPKWCGKTTTAEQHANSILYMTKPEDIKENLVLADMNPRKLLEGNTPRLIDEWQIAPKLWDAVRFEADHSSTLTEDTIYSYTNALRKIFVIEDMLAWNPNLRSKTAVRTSNTRYFIDPSIAAASLGLGPADLTGDLSTMGLFFETLCVRDLRVYAESIDGGVFHYRDKSGLECDAVIRLKNGAFGLVERKLGGDHLIEEGTANLRKLAAKIDTTKMKEPSFLMVLTAVGKYAYQRKDGVLVVPVGTLRD